MSFVILTPVMPMIAITTQYEIKPIEFRDKLGEPILIRPYNHKTDRNGLVEMYVHFDPEDRCLGLPPLTRECIERWIDYLVENGCNFVAEHNGRIVGHVAVIPLNNQREVELDIFVWRPYQGRGIGQELLRYAIEFCRQKRFRGIMVATDCSNLRAKRLFRKFGFITINEGLGDCYMYLKL